MNTCVGVLQTGYFNRKKKNGESFTICFLKQNKTNYTFAPVKLKIYRSSQVTKKKNSFYINIRILRITLFVLQYTKYHSRHICKQTILNMISK